MPGKSSGAIIGYKYYLGMHMVLCSSSPEAPIDAILGIIVGDRVLYGGDFTAGQFEFLTTGISTSGDIVIRKSQLFGGETREGGIEGTIGILFGEPSQVPDPYLKSFFGWACPAFRGVTSVILKLVYVGVNPYLKPWSFVVRRTSCPTWEVAYSQIRAIDSHYDANGAHIIRELLTDKDFGSGWPISKIDNPSFSGAAHQLYTEGFGLAFIWDQQSSIEEVIQKILNHINGVLYISQTTGLFTLKLLRADYVISALPVYNESNILEMPSFQRVGWGETVNEVIVRYTDRFSGAAGSTVVQDLANMQVQGGIVSRTITYSAICDADLASRVALRDLQSLSTPVAKVIFKVNRTAWNLCVGDVFVLHWSKLGVSSVVFRVGNVNRGTLLDGTITVTAVEDVFGLPGDSYVAHEAQFLVTATMNPIPAINQRLIEANYHDIVMARGATFAAQLDPNATFVLGVAQRPTVTTHAFNFITSGASVNGPYDGTYSGSYSPTCKLPALGREMTSTCEFTEGTDMGLISVGDYGYIGDEAVSVAAIDWYSITLNRGVLDTSPAIHGPDYLFIVSTFRAVNTWEYVKNDYISGYILPRYPLGTLTPAGTDALELTLQGRQSRPYPPAGLQISYLYTYERPISEWPVGRETDWLVNYTYYGYESPPTYFSQQVQIMPDEYYPTHIEIFNIIKPTSTYQLSMPTSHIVFSWARRNRTTQTVWIITQGADDLGPEPGTYYKLVITSASVPEFRYELTTVVDAVNQSPHVHVQIPRDVFDAYNIPGAVYTLAVTTMRGSVASYQDTICQFTIDIDIPRTIVQGQFVPTPRAIEPIFLPPYVRPMNPLSPGALG